MVFEPLPGVKRPYEINFFFLAAQNSNLRCRTIEDGDGVASLLPVAIGIGYLGTEQSVRLHPDLM